MSGLIQFPKSSAAGDEGFTRGGLGFLGGLLLCVAALAAQGAILWAVGSGAKKAS